MVMSINIRNLNDYKDNNGLLGKALLSPDETVEVYRIHSKARYCNCNINIVNAGLDVATCTIYMSFKREPSLEDIVESKIILEPDAVYVRTNIIMGKNEALFVRSDNANCIVRLEGFENNPL